MSSSGAPKEGLADDAALTQAVALSSEVTDANSTVRPEWASDPQNPMNWSSLRQYSIVSLISVAGVTASACSTAFEPALPTIMKDFHSDSDSLSSLFITAYLLGYVLGPLLVAPASELYGRTPLLLPAYVLLMATLVVCATATTLTTFIVIRCIMGFAANAFVVVGPAIIADMIPQDRRGLALSVLSSGPILGPTLGPLIGGFIVQGLGWRWVFWMALILFGALTIISLFVLRETYAPVLQLQQQRAMVSGYRHRRFSFTLPRLPHSPQGKSPRAVLLAAFVRPPKLFFLAPIIPLLALYTSVSYAYLNVLIATLGTVFEVRDGFGPAASGLVYLGMAIGFVVGLVTTGLFADRLAMWFATRRQSRTPRSERILDTTFESSRNGVDTGSTTVPAPEITVVPEARLPLAVLGALFMVPSILMYGYTLVSPVHWIIPLIATAFVACCAVWSFISAQMYLVDAYGIFAASATGAVSIFRAVCAALVPLAANPAYDRWGWGWGNAVFALVCVPFIPLAVG